MAGCEVAQQAFEVVLRQAGQGPLLPASLAGSGAAPQQVRDQLFKLLPAEAGCRDVDQTQCLAEGQCDVKLLMWQLSQFRGLALRPLLAPAQHDHR